MQAETALVYLQIADLARPLKIGLVEEAARRTYKAVQLESDNTLTVRMSIAAFEGAADLSETNRCVRYGNAIRLVGHLRNLAKDNLDSVEPGWTRTRRDLEQTDARVRWKAARAGCTLEEKSAD